MPGLRCAGSLRGPSRDSFTEAWEGARASHWLNWSLATPAGSSFTRTGGLQPTPLSVDLDTKMSVPLDAVSSIHEQYSVPRLGPVLVSAPHAGYTRAPLLAWAGEAARDATLVGEMVCVGPKLWPPSAELASTLAVFWTSCQARGSVPSGATN